MPNKVLVLGSEGLLGHAICRHLVGLLDPWWEAVRADVAGTPEYKLDVFGRSPEEREMFVAILELHAPLHVVDATYPNQYTNYDAYLSTWDYLCKRLPQGGSLTLLSSIYGIHAHDPLLYQGTTVPPTPLWYAFFKGGVISVTRHLATMYAPKVRVNCISPGGVANGQDPEFVGRYSYGTPLARMATPQDIASAVAFLVSPGASYITGHNLVVDGGRSIW